MILLEDDMTFRTIRLDHYVLRRNFKGDPIEIIYIEHVADDSDEDAHVSVSSASYSNTKVAKKGYKCVYHRLVWSDEENAGISLPSSIKKSLMKVVGCSSSNCTLASNYRKRLYRSC